MKLSYNWLKEYIDLSDVSAEDLANKLTTAGIEVEGVDKLAEASGLVIGQVMECEDVEGTHLHKTQTCVGENTYQIVCGAPNCRKGLKVIVALPGAVLPAGKIEARPLRGMESNGMLCSLAELGVDPKVLRDEQINGIEELDEDAPVGETDVLGYLGLDDTILDVSLTPNRADCSAMWNMAKEVGAILHREVKWPNCTNLSDEGEETDFTIDIRSDKCSAYVGKVIKNVKVKESPKWLKNYLQAAGMNSINNVVDISNFVMLETGQPLHFYDYNKLRDHSIIVEDDKELSLTALDGKTFDIEKGDILIADNHGPIGIAGVMGGEESMIDENTTAIFVEAAHFNHASIRKTSIRLNLITEAAQRFTKGIEEAAMLKAMDRTVQLLKEYAEASGLEKTVIAGSINTEEKVIVETLSHCNGLLGTNFTMEEVVDTLTWLDFKPEVNGDEITCHIPTYRIDVEGKADIDEEVIRLIGFDSLNTTLPQVNATVGRLSKPQSLRRLTRNYLMGCGLNEIVTYTLVSDEYVNDTFNPLGEAVALAMPMSEARKYVRNSLINSVLECLQYNKAHQNQNNAFYEISKVYATDTEQERLAIVLDGKLNDDVLHHNELENTFYTMKGIIEEYLVRCGFSTSRIKIKENTTDIEHFHPYRSAEIYLDKNKLGVFGELHPNYAKKYDLDRTIYAELNIEPLYNTKSGRLKFEEINKFPAVSRDIAVVVDRNLEVGKLFEAIRRSGAKILSNIEVFDVYEGEHVESDKKSIALTLTYQSNHTLNDEEINEAHNKILEAIKNKVNGELRG